MIINFVYMMFLVIGSLISLTGSSWFIVWLGLEVNMMAFVPLVSLGNSFSAEMLFKYYLVQVLSSLFLFLMGVIHVLGIGFMGMYNEMLSVSFIILALMVKMGVSPFHFWYLIVAEGMDWFGLLVLMTWQKVVPLGVVFLIKIINSFFMLIGLLSVLVGSFGGVGTMMLRKMFVYSSVSHLGWLMIIMPLSEMVVYFYFSVYSFVLCMVISYLMILEFSYIWQVSVMSGLGFYLGLLSLGGFPPLLGFFSKWFSLMLMMFSGYGILVLLLVVVGIYVLYFYLRVIYMMVLLGGFSNLWCKNILVTSVMWHFLMLFSLSGLGFVFIIMS